MHEKTNATRNAAYDETTIGTWIFAQYDCSDGTAGIVPSFQVDAVRQEDRRQREHEAAGEPQLVAEREADEDRHRHRGKERERAVEIEQRPDAASVSKRAIELRELRGAAENRERHAEVAAASPAREKK